MAEDQYRIEHDSMGEIEVPVTALWGASTQRAVNNFDISGRRMPAGLINAYAMVKHAAAGTNRELGLLDVDIAQAVMNAAAEIADGRYAEHFPVDVFQTGSGTSTNMNINEVIANLANLALGSTLGTKAPVHPNDHVNLGQSSNDTFPTAMHIAAVCALHNDLQPALSAMDARLEVLSRRWDAALKLGRTHLMDATPVRVGQVFGGYRVQAARALAIAREAERTLCELPIGGTAVGTGMNTHDDFGRLVCAALAEATGRDFRCTKNHFEAQSARDAVVQVSGGLKTIAVSLSKIANDLRWLGSGPRGGLGELTLPETQPGSSIMPGKVNPVICESVIQAAVRVIANDTAITYGGFGGVGSIFELNTAMPLIADSLLESLTLLARCVVALSEKVLDGLVLNETQCANMLANSLMNVTALTTAIGYDAAAAIARKAYSEDTSIREAALASGLIDAETLDEALDPRNMV